MRVGKSPVADRGQDRPLIFEPRKGRNTRNFRPVGFFYHEGHGVHEGPAGGIFLGE